jgi:hypothetical protein
MSATSTHPITSASRRLPMARSIKLAGRKMVESKRIPGRVGARRARAASTPRVTATVLASGCFSTMSRRPGRSLMIASPMGGGWSSTTAATSPRRSGATPRGTTATSARDSAVVTPATCRTDSR